jgi:hypothetical protein
MARTATSKISEQGRKAKLLKRDFGFTCLAIELAFQTFVTTVQRETQICLK